MNKLFQIKADDLAILEQAVPRLVDIAMESLDNNKSRVQIRRIQKILSDVRWNYGPHSDVETIPAGDKT